MSVFYEKKTSNWWFILGFICPIAGLILFFTLKEKKREGGAEVGNRRFVHGDSVCVCTAHHTFVQAQSRSRVPSGSRYILIDFGKCGVINGVAFYFAVIHYERRQKKTLSIKITTAFAKPGICPSATAMTE